MIIEVKSEGVPEKIQDHFLQLVPIKVKNESSFQANIQPFFNDYIQPSSNVKDNSSFSTVFRGHPNIPKVFQWPCSCVLSFSACFGLQIKKTKYQYH